MVFALAMRAACTASQSTIDMVVSRTSRDLLSIRWPLLQPARLWLAMSQCRGTSCSLDCVASWSRGILGHVRQAYVRADKKGTQCSPSESASVCRLKFRGFQPPHGTCLRERRAQHVDGRRCATDVATSFFGERWAGQAGWGASLQYSRKLTSGQPRDKKVYGLSRSH